MGYHLVNVLLHAASAVLLWRLLVRLGVPGAWLAAALFGLHPVNVETVAWITERKNVLSGFFSLAAALAYFRFDPADAEPPPSRSWRWWGAALALFAAALLSKTVAATLPASLLLVAWWRGRRLDRATIIPLLPFFLLGFSGGMVTLGWRPGTSTPGEWHGASLSSSASSSPGGPSSSTWANSPGRRTFRSSIPAGKSTAPTGRSGSTRWPPRDSCWPSSSCGGASVAARWSRHSISPAPSCRPSDSSTSTP